jgi:thioredoxin reductase/ferredoxin
VNVGDLAHAVTVRLLALSPREWLAGAAAGGALIAAVYLLGRWLEHRRARATLDEAVRLELTVPGSLHPVIDRDVCIGSGSCISACPEGRILGLVNGVATLVDASSCIGHGRCAAECPVGAIRLVFGSAERGVDLPEVDTAFETSRPGVHVVGELGGMGLIKNALTQGLQVAAGLRASLGARPPGADRTDVVIVGAGPAGIAAAVGARAAGLSFELVEQDTVGGTVAHYPRQKLVMTETVKLPFYGPFGRARLSKEELVASFADVLAAARIEVRERAKVIGIDGQRDDFLVTTSRGAVRARRVVLAIGRRGTPRPLGVPGQDLPKVTYRLIDPEQYQGRRVLVVGGGDSALEAAIQLADASDAEVTIAYRGPQFARCRPLNRERLHALVARGRVRPLMLTEIAAVEEHAVHLEFRGRPEALANDFVIACLGGELPTQFLQSVGVSIRRHVGDRAMANPALGGRPLPTAHDDRRSALTLAFIGTAILIGLAAIGNAYYLVPRAARYQMADHDFLKPSGRWGHSVGILATAFMLLNFVYPLRKRVRRFKRKGPIAPWLRFHVFVGLMSPAVILFHSAFQWGNHLATATYVALVTMVVTGLVGRFIYGQLRTDADDPKRAAADRADLRALLDALPAPLPAAAAPLSALVDGTLRLPRTIPGLVLQLPLASWTFARAAARVGSAFLDGRSRHGLRVEALRLWRLEAKLRLHQRWKGLLQAWRVVHVTLSLLLVTLIGLHVWISIRTGFRGPWR